MSLPYGDAAMAAAALSTLFVAASALLSGWFVLRGRLGRVWLLVTLALVLVAAMEGGSLYSLATGWQAFPLDPGRESVLLAFSFLVLSGFALTERWFRLRDRVEGRFLLFREVERQLVGVLEEEGILEVACRILGDGSGYVNAWIGVRSPDGTIPVVRASGGGAEALADLSLRWDDRAVPSSAAEALRTGRLAVSAPGTCDLAFPRHAGFPAVRHSASVPVRHREDPAFVLTVCTAARRGFDRVELAALETLGERLEAALESARRHEYFHCAKRAYDEVLRAQRDGTVLVRGGVVVRANPAALSLLGHRDASTLVGTDAGGLVDGRDGTGARAAEVLRSRGGSGGTRRWELAARRRDGTLFPCEVAVTFLPRKGWHERYENPLSGDLGMVVLHDLTEQRTAYAEISRQRDFIAMILRISGVLVVQADPSGTILLFNGKSEECTGFPSLQAVGKDMAALLVPPSHRGAWRRAFVEASLSAGRECRSHEFPLVTASGEERHVLWNFAALRDASGKVSSVVATGTDVTDRKSLERQITEMQKMEAVGTLAGGVAHDFNNLLTGIMGNLEIAELLVPPGSNEGRALSEALRAADRAAQLVRQLLDFSRKAPLETRPTPLPPILGEVRGLLSQSIDRRIELVEEVAPSLPPVLGDPGRIHQVVMNLCVNARDAVLERIEREGGGSGRIRVAASEATVEQDYLLAYPYARTGRFVLLEIEDDGSGMDEAVQRRIFEPFFTTKRLGRGTGLGLSTVYGIVKQHDGWINLDSSPGRGTSFRVYLPVAPERPVAPSPRASLPREGTRGNERILVVDDEAMIRDLATQVLERRGYAVTCACDGREALERFGPRGEEFDLVLLDQTMPHLTGTEVLREIRLRAPSAKVIMSSGYTLQEAPAMAAFLQKPYRVETLARLVREVLDRP